MRHGPGLLALTVSLLVILGCSGLVGEVPLDASDRAILVLPSDLGLHVDPAGVAISKTRAFDGAWVLEAEFEDDEVYLGHTVYYEPRRGDVLLGMVLQRAAARAMLDGDWVAHPDLMRWGDDRSCWRHHAGFLCIASKDHVYFMLMVAGLSIEDAPGAVEAQWGDKLAALDGWVPKGKPGDPERPSGR